METESSRSFKGWNIRYSGIEQDPKDKGTDISILEVNLSTHIWPKGVRPFIVLRSTFGRTKSSWEGYKWS